MEKKIQREFRMNESRMEGAQNFIDDIMDSSEDLIYLEDIVDYISVGDVIDWINRSEGTEGLKYVRDKCTEQIHKLNEVH